MKKADFISRTDLWLTRQDICDFIHSPSQISKMDVVHYLKMVEQMLKHKAPELLTDFYESVKNAKVRGTSDYIKKCCRGAK